MTESGGRPLQSIEVQIQVPLRASRAQVWRALVEETSLWWPRQFVVGPPTRRFIIENFAGGRVYEDWGDGEGRLWGTILAFEREQLLQVAADFAPEYGGPARSIVSYRLHDDGVQHCILEVQDSLFGALSNITRESLAEGWKSLLFDCFKAFVESRLQEAPDSVETRG